MKKYTTKKIITGILSVGIMSLFVLPLVMNTALAQSSSDNSNLWEGVQNNLNSNLKDKTLPNIITGIINIIMGVLGVIVVLIILWGGFIWMTAGGETDKVEKAKKMIYSGIIGLIIIISSYAIASFVLNAISSIGGTGSTS